MYLRAKVLVIEDNPDSIELMLNTIVPCKWAKKKNYLDGFMPKA